MSKPAITTHTTTTALADILFTQGFGTRRICDGLIAAGLVRHAGQVLRDPAQRLPANGLQLEVEGQPWTCQDQALVLLNKPAGYECSQKPSTWPSVLLLLPAALRQRGVQTVGRLDQDTTGLLLLTDDGPLIHRLTSPRHHVPKVYEVQTDRPLDELQLQRLRKGVVLDDDPCPVAAEGAEATGEKSLRLTLVQGKYHQVKRMVAAVGNHCAALHRSGYGALTLGDPTAPDPAPGHWRFVTDDERALLMKKAPR